MHPLQQIALHFVTFLFRLPQENKAQPPTPRRTEADRELLESCLDATYKPQYPARKYVKLDSKGKNNVNKTSPQ